MALARHKGLHALEHMGSERKNLALIMYLMERNTIVESHFLAADYPAVEAGLPFPARKMVKVRLCKRHR